MPKTSTTQANNSTAWNRKHVSLNIREPLNLKFKIFMDPVTRAEETSDTDDRSSISSEEDAASGSDIEQRVCSKFFLLFCFLKNICLTCFFFYFKRIFSMIVE